MTTIPFIRQIILDTETTGINHVGLHYQGHNIIEIGAVEIIRRRFTGNNFHVYLKPNRFIDPEASKIHGITDKFLLDKPTFAEIADKFFDYIYGSELIIHNASFDVGFIDNEFKQLNRGIQKINSFCKIIDSLELAKKVFPGKKNSLDALCSRYQINNKKRTKHSAFLDAKLLASVYLMMTSGQTSMLFSKKNEKHISDYGNNSMNQLSRTSNKLRIILANKEELVKHDSCLDSMQNQYGKCLWSKQ